MDKRWYADFQRGGTDTHDAERSDHANSAVVPENTKKLHKLILADPKVKVCKIGEELEISEGSLMTILHEHSSMRKLCSKGVARLLRVDKKQQHIDDSGCALQLFQRSKNGFFA